MTDETTYKRLVFRSVREGSNLGDLVARTLASCLEGENAAEVAAEAARRGLELHRFCGFIAAVSAQQTYQVFPKQFAGAADAQQAALNDRFRVGNCFDRQSGLFFISYRRSDAGDLARTVFDALANTFSEEAIFLDVNSMPIGSDFRREIRLRVAASRLVTVVVGPHWSGSPGEPRLYPNDPVRLEVEAALELDIPMLVIAEIPDHFPAADRLPETLRGLLGAPKLVAADFADTEAFLEALVDECRVLARGTPLSLINMPDLDRDTAIAVRSLVEAGRLFDMSVADFRDGASVMDLIGGMGADLEEVERIAIKSQLSWGRTDHLSDEADGGIGGDGLVHMWAEIFEAVFGRFVGRLSAVPGFADATPIQMAAAAAVGMAEAKWQFVRRSALERRYWPATLEQLGALARDYFHAPLIRRIALSPDFTVPFSAGARFRSLLGQCLDELVVPYSAVPRTFAEPQDICVYLCLLDEQLTTCPDREAILHHELDACDRAGVAIVPVSLGSLSRSAFLPSALTEKLLRYSVFEIRDDPLFVRDIEALAAWCRLRAIPQVMLSEVPVPARIPAYAAPALKTLSGAVDTLRLILMECLLAGKAGPTAPSDPELLHLSRRVLNYWGSYLNATKDDGPD